MAQPSASRRLPNLAKWLIAVCAVLLLYSLVFWLPALLKAYLEDDLPLIIHRRVAVQSIEINPYVLSLRIHGLAVHEPDGAPFVSFEELFVNVQLSSVFQKSLNFKDITLKKPAARVVVRKGGTTNFDDLLKSRPEASRDQPTFQKLSSGIS
jgi:hypothetical protein